MRSTAACRAATSTVGVCPGGHSCRGKGKPLVAFVRGSQPAASAMPRASENGGRADAPFAPVATSAAPYHARRHRAGGA